jgi:mRNA interferase MazF
MEKDFEGWHGLKRLIHEMEAAHIPAGYKERDIWWVCLGHNVGFEEDGKHEHFERPVLIVKGFSKRLFWGLPLTSVEKEGKYYHKFVMNGRNSTAILSQMRAFDTKRLINKLGVVNQKDFAELKLKLIDFLA